MDKLILAPLDGRFVRAFLRFSEIFHAISCGRGARGIPVDRRSEGLQNPDHDLPRAFGWRKARTSLEGVAGEGIAKKSGWWDLNPRPLGPEPSALAKLRYIP